MLGEFAMRLAIALPLTCAAAALFLLLVRRGWVPLPGQWWRPRAKAERIAADLPLRVLCVRSLTPVARVAVVDFRGRELLIGINQQALVVLADSSQPAAEG